MGFIDFFKKLAQTNRLKQLETKKITFDEIENYLKDKEKAIENKEKQIFNLIENKILTTTKQLNEKLTALETVDIDSKKVEGQIKLIVKENLNNYIALVKNLIQNLNDLKEENLEKLTSKINEIFLNFDKRSNMNYQKATFLIGKKIAAVKITITNLFRYLQATFDKNKDIIEEAKTISLIKSKLNQINEINEITNETNEKINFLDKKIINTNQLKKTTLDEIEKIKKSDNYIENLNKEEKIKSAESELEEEFYKLKQMIDFKALGNIFHVDEKKMDIIKAYKENFQEAFQESNLDILNLLDEAELNNNTILNKLEQIKLKQEKIKNKKKEIEKDKTKDLLDEIEKIKLEINNLNNEKDRSEKTFNKLKINKEEIKNSIKQELAKINVIV